MSLRIVYTGTRLPDPIDGVRVVHVPMLGIRPIDVDESTVRSFANSGTNFVFYSSNGVDSLKRSTRLLDEIPAGVVVWAVGERTAEALEIIGISGVSVPSDQRYEGLLEELPPGRHVSFELQDGERSLADSRPHDEVLTVTCYASVLQVDDSRPIWREPPPDWVVFTSPRGFDAFLRHEAANDWLKAARIAAIGPTTAEAMSASGLQPHFVPNVPDAQLLLESLASIDGSDI